MQTRIPKSLRVVAVILILLLAALLRIIPLPLAGALSFDEAWSVWLTQKSLPAAFQVIAYDKHPPLFYTVLFSWIRVVGTSEFAIRAISALIGILNVALLYRVGREMFNVRVGRLAALLIAVNPFQIFYAQEARMYPLTLTFLLLSVFFLWQVRERATLRYWGGYIFSTLLLLLTHYVAGLVVLGQAVFLMWDARQNRERVATLKQWLIALAAIGALGILWFPNALFQIGLDSGPPAWIERLNGIPGLKDFPLTIVRDFLIFAPDYSRQARLWIYATTVLLLLAAILRFKPHFPFVQLPLPGAGLFCLACLLLPIAGVWLISQFRPMFVSRYFYAYAAFLYLLLAWGISRISLRWIQVPLILSLVFIMGDGSIRLASAQRERDWRSIANYITTHWQAGDVIVITPPANWMVFQYYAQNRVPADLDFYRKLYPADPAPTSQAAVSAALLDPALLYRRLWWIDEQGTELAAEWILDSGSAARGFLDNHFFRENISLALSSRWGDVVLYDLTTRQSENRPATPRAFLTATCMSNAPAPPVSSNTPADVIVDWSAVAIPSPASYGVNGWWSDEDPELWRSRYTQLAPQVVRVPIAHGLVEPVNDNAVADQIDWRGFHFDSPIPVPFTTGRYTTYRRWFEVLRERDITLLLYSPYLPGWLSANGDQGLFSTFPPKDVAEYGEFIRALVTFLVDEVKYPPNRIILEPVNEADLGCGADQAVPCFWNNWQASDLLAVVKAAHDQAASVHPAIRIAGLAVCCNADLMPWFMDQYGGAQYLDVITYHYYESDLDFSRALAWGRALQAYGQPVYLDEFGNTTYWSNGVPGALWHSAVLPQAWTAGITPVQFPVSEWQGMNVGFNDLGLFYDWTRNWALKPAYWVYVNFYDLFGGADLVGTATPSGARAIAARRNSPPMLAIWLTNLKPREDSPVVFQVNHLPTDDAVITVFNNLISPRPSECWRVHAPSRTLVFGYPGAIGSYTFVIQPTLP